MNWDNVEMIRNAQASNQKRFDEEHIAVQERIEKAMQSEAFNQLAVPRMTELESMIFKMRSELIDYIVAHGLVDGLIWDGVLQPVENGKIVITKELVETITEKLGYYKEDDVLRFIEKYLPEHDYVSDGDYVHTDNNFRNEDVEKLAGIEDGAEVNKVIDILFNGTSVLDDGTRVATITITPADIKRWYESNADTNAFTDKEKAKLAGISDGAEVNRVDDVIVNGRSVLDENKKALLTKEVIKEAYEANSDTNAFTDAEKARLADINSLRVFTLSANAIKDLEKTEYGVDGVFSTDLKVKVTLTDENKKTQTRTVTLEGYAAFDVSDDVSGQFIHMAYMNPDAGTDGLQSVIVCGTYDLDIVAQVNVNADNFHAVNASIDFVNLHRIPTNVIDVTVDGESVRGSNGVANVRSVDVSGFVPYVGATEPVDLNTQSVFAGSYEANEPASTYKEDSVRVSAHGVNVDSDSNGRTNGWGAPINFGWSGSKPLAQMRIAPGAKIGMFYYSAYDDPEGLDPGSNAHAFMVGDPSDAHDAATKGYVDNRCINTYDVTIAKGLVNKIEGATNRFAIDAKITIDVTYKSSDGVSNDASFTVGGVLQIDSNGLIAANQTLLPIDANATSLKIVEVAITSATSASTTVSIKVNGTWLNASITNIYYASGITLAYSETDQANSAISFYSANQPARIISKTPISDEHVATKKYVDDAVAGASGGAIVECEASDSDIRVMTVDTETTISLTAVKTITFTPDSSGDVKGAWTSANDSFIVRAGQKLVFVPWYSSSSKAYYRTVHPASKCYYLYYEKGSEDNISVSSVGTYLASYNTNMQLSAGGFPKTSSDIVANSTSKYYKFQ